MIFDSDQLFGSAELWTGTILQLSISNAASMDVEP
jgi:hypothetical protein